MVGTSKPSFFSYLGIWTLLLILQCDLSGASAFGADSAYMDQPLAIMAVAGLERVEKDLIHLGEVSGNKKPAQQLQILQKKLQQFPGIDRQRPIGGMLVLHREKLELPTFLVMLPVTDGEKFVTAFKKKVPVVQTIKKGNWKINIPNMPLYANLQDKYLLIAQRRNTHQHVTSEMLKSLETQTRQNDVSVSLLQAGISDPLRNRIIEGFQIELNKELEQKPNEKDKEYALRKELIELIRLTGLQLFTKMEQISATLQIESDIQLSAEFKVAQESDLSDVLASLPLAEKRVPGVSTESRPVRIQFSLNIPQPFQVFALNILKQVREDVRRDLSPHLAEADRMPVRGAFDAIQQSIDDGKLDGLIEFQEIEETRMVLIGGLRILGNSLMATSLETILPYARDSKDITEVEMNVINNEHLKLHRLKGKEPRDEDRRLYGDELSLFVGTGANSLWLSVGGEKTPELISDLSSHDAKPVESIVQIDFSFDPWLRLGEKHQQDLEKVKRFRQAFPDDQNDKVHFDIKSSASGFNATLHAESGYLKLLGLAMEKSEAEKQAAPETTR
ncbi:hypothetical protein [Thalassoglobus sp.]|uniref:hypothetical protein n=1 Tax=Thalassoglobus sp. TaxID=2795869 RepID=UPI003AA980CE